MTTPTTAPYRDTVEHLVPAAAITVTAGNVIDVARFTGTIKSVRYTTPAAITGADTHTRKVELVNRGAAGLGTTVIASLQFNAGVDTVAFDETDITLSATAADLAVAQGDVLEWRTTAVGNGLADPGGFVRVELDR